MGRRGQKGHWFFIDELVEHGVDQSALNAILAKRLQEHRARQVESKARLKTAWSPERREAERVKQCQRSAAKLLRETPEQREHRLNYYREYGRAHPRKHRTKQS